MSNQISLGHILFVDPANSFKVWTMRECLRELFDRQILFFRQLCEEWFQVFNIALWDFHIVGLADVLFVRKIRMTALEHR